MSFLTPKGRFQPFALCKCDSNRLVAIFPQFSIGFVQISMQSTTLSEETKGQGIVQENFTPGQGIIFRNLTPGQGSFLDFPAARPRMLNLRVASSSFLFVSMVNRSSPYKINLSKTSFERAIETMREQYCIDTNDKAAGNVPCPLPHHLRDTKR